MWSVNLQIEGPRWTRLLFERKTFESVFYVKLSTSGFSSSNLYFLVVKYASIPLFSDAHRSLSFLPSTIPNLTRSSGTISFNERTLVNKVDICKLLESQMLMFFFCSKYLIWAVTSPSFGAKAATNFTASSCNFFLYASSSVMSAGGRNIRFL